MFILDTKRKFILLTAIFSIVIIGIGGAAYYFWREASEIKRNPQKAAQEETQMLINKVSRLIVLPDDDETPTIGTVTDPEKLKDQPFFAKAKIGDKVLIYTNAKKAILYDPINNKIVEVSSLNIGGELQSLEP